MRNNEEGSAASKKTYQCQISKGRQIGSNIQRSTLASVNPLLYYMHIFLSNSILVDVSTDDYCSIYDEKVSGMVWYQKNYKRLLDKSRSYEHSKLSLTILFSFLLHIFRVN